MFELCVTLITLQPEMSWLKAVAPLNMSIMVVTLATFDPQVRGELKAMACANMPSMLVTLDTSQADKSWLKTDEANMYSMSVTLLTSHPERSWLNALALYRKE